MRPPLETETTTALVPTTGMELMQRPHWDPENSQVMAARSTYLTAAMAATLIPMRCQASTGPRLKTSRRMKCRASSN